MSTAANDDFTDLELGDFPGLLAVSQFARMVRDVPWFSTLAEELDEREINLVEDYLSGLGFPDASIVTVEDWEEAAEALQNPDWDTAFWEVEEQARVALTAEACERADEEAVNLALTHVSHLAAESAADAVTVAASRFDVVDEELLRAAAGAATQACYHAALVLAAETEDQETHPFAAKYRLFEFGRWPLGLVGATYYLF